MTTTSTRTDTRTTAPGRRRPQAGPPLPVPAAVALALSIAAGVVFSSGPRPGTASMIALQYLREHQQRTQLVAFLVFGAAFPLAVYGATAYRRLRRLGVTAPGSAIAFAGGVLASGALLVSGLVLWSAAHSSSDLDAATARVLLDLSFASGGMGFAASLALLLAGVAVPCLVLRLAPRWLAWLGLALATVGVVATVGLLSSVLYPLLPIARFGGLLWLVAVGVTLPVQRRSSS